MFTSTNICSVPTVTTNGPLAGKSATLSTVKVPSVVNTSLVKVAVRAVCGKTPVKGAVLATGTCSGVFRFRMPFVSVVEWVFSTLTKICSLSMLISKVAGALRNG